MPDLATSTQVSWTRSAATYATDGVVVLPLHAPPSLLTQTLTCMDLMCGLGAFHQAVGAANIGANRSRPHQGESHRLRCTAAVDIDPVTTAVYSTNYRGTPTVTLNLTDIAKWHSLAEPTHIMMAGPPCQGWSAAGDMMQWSESRSLPLALVPLYSLVLGGCDGYN